MHCHQWIADTNSYTNFQLVPKLEVGANVSYYRSVVEREHMQRRKLPNWQCQSFERRVKHTKCRPTSRPSTSRRPNDQIKSQKQYWITIKNQKRSNSIFPFLSSRFAILGFGLTTATTSSTWIATRTTHSNMTRWTSSARTTAKEHAPTRRRPTSSTT